MRLLLLIAAAVGVSSAAVAQPVSDGAPVWRMHTEHLTSDRALIRTCLARDADGFGCVLIVQKECLAGYDRDNVIPALERQCDWRAIAAWEDEMNGALARLRPHLDGVDASQSAWEASMLADVGVGMDALTGGALAGPVGAHIRARETATRALYLRDLIATFVEE